MTPLRQRLTVVMADDTVHNVKTPKTFGQRVSVARQDMGIGVNELNKIVRLPNGEGLSTGYISRLENDVRDDIPATYALSIAHALGVRVEWLIDGTGPKRFASGEMPVTFEAAKSNKANLERVLMATAKGRWHPTTLGVARAMDADREIHEWPSFLDTIEKTLEFVVTTHDRPVRP